MFPTKTFFNLTKNSLRCIHSTCPKFENKLVTEQENVKFREDILTTSTIDRWFEKINLAKLDLSIASVKSFAKNVYRRQVISDQLYNPQRVEILGPDLAIAHFVTHRGGIVKFANIDTIYNHKNKLDLPPVKDESYLIEAVNTSGMRLLYEGLDHFRDLKHLRSVSFRGNLEFDSWYMDRLSNIIPHVEYLDLGFCKKLNHHALSSIYRMRNLKCLNVEGISNSVEFHLTCLTIEAENPNLSIIGIVTKPKAKSAFDSDD